MPEIAFRAAVLVCVVAYMTTRSVFEARLGRKKKREQFAEAPARDRTQLLVVAVGSLPMYFYVGTEWLTFASMPLPGAVRVFGGMVTAGSVGLLAWSHAALGQNWSPFVERPGAGALVTTGPYRFVRHPMYTSFLLYNAGLWLMSANWLAGAAAFGSFAYLYADRVDHEERLMLDLFGEEYRRFAAKRGRLLPGIGGGSLAGERLG